jgi:hypothetical protein
MRKGVAGLAIAVAVLLILVGAFVRPSPHEVRTPGAQELNPQLVNSDARAYSFQALQPSESVSDVRCAMWRLGHSQTSECPDATTLAGLYFPKVTQSTKTLYVPWLGCAYTMGADGFNVEYQPSRRAVVIHCYVARPWVWKEAQTMGAEPQPRLTLLLVPIDSIQAGPVIVIQDDRVEYFFRDQSYEFQLGTATISYL